MATATKPRRTALGLTFVISREKLLEGLSAVSSIIPTKSTLPILGNVMLAATETGVQFTATDLDIAVGKTVAADVESTGAVTVPAKRLLAIAKELPPAPVRVTIGKDNVVQINCGRSNFRLFTLPSDEFPEIPNVEYNAGQLKTGQLKSMVARCAFATSNEESRPILNGILVQRGGDVLRLVATNGHKLARLERAVESQFGEFKDIIVPPKALTQAGKLFADEDDVEIGFGDNHLGLKTLDSFVVTRLIEGPYPDFSRVIPTSTKQVMIVDRLALISAVRRVSPIASDTSHRLTLNAASGMLSVKVNTPDVGEASDELPIRIDGGGIRFGMNAQYLLQVLGAIETESVRILATSPSRAFVFEPDGADASNRALYLVMPIRVME